MISKLHENYLNPCFHFDKPLAISASHLSESTTQSVGQFVSWSVCQLVGHSVGRLVSQSVGCLVGPSVCPSIHQFVSQAHVPVYRNLCKQFLKAF